MKWYVGVHNLEPHNRFAFTTATPPTQADYPHFLYVIGPFVTRRGARFMRDFGQGNPHCQTVSDAEKLSRKAS